MRQSIRRCYVAQEDSVEIYTSRRCLFFILPIATSAPSARHIEWQWYKSNQKRRKPCEASLNNKSIVRDGIMIVSKCGLKVCYDHLEVNLWKRINQWVCWGVAGHCARHVPTIVDGKFFKFIFVLLSIALS